jgi:cytoskeletal protein CcmA (bactofilin family)
MFEKFSNKSMAVNSEKFDTIIGRTTTIQGTLVLLDSVRIDGRVLGNIESAPDCKIAVAIGPTGEVTGDIKAHRVMVAGKVFGHIHAADRVEFQKDSLVQGDVSYGSIAVEHGAKLSGLILQNKTMEDSATGAQAAIQTAQSVKNTS